MIHRLRFYFTYALRNIRRGGRWTTLAILCITAGVATVVALRSLGLAVGDTLTNNVRIEVKGDLLAQFAANTVGQRRLGELVDRRRPAHRSVTGANRPPLHHRYSTAR